MYTTVAVTLDIFCIRPFALHRQKNVDFAPPGKISADAHGCYNVSRSRGTKKVENHCSMQICCLKKKFNLI